MFDPFDRIDSLTSPYARADVPAARPTIEPLTPQEEDSLLATIGAKALGGIGYVGGVLDKTFGGRAIRGLLGGRPRELLSIIPGSDVMGITDEKDRVGGKELLGFSPDDDSWGGMLGGMAAEIALDPGTYLTFGGSAISEAGQLAKMAGALPKTAAGRVQTLRGFLTPVNSTAPELARVAELSRRVGEAAGASGKSVSALLEQPLGGLAGVGWPFARPSYLIGGGEAGANVLAGASRANQALRTAPVVGKPYSALADALDAGRRYAGALFDRTTMGATSAEGQAAARQALESARPLEVEARANVARWARELADVGLEDGAALRDILETPAARVAGPYSPEVLTVAAEMKNHLGSYLHEMQRLGIPVGSLVDDAVDYFPRQQAELAKPTAGVGRPRQPIVAADARVESREPFLKNIPGGTGAINRAVRDADIATGTPLEAAHVARERYLGMTPEDFKELRRLSASPPPARIQNAADISVPNPAAQRLAELRGRFEQGASLADWVRNLDPQYRDNGLDFFGNHPLQDFLTYSRRTASLRGAADAAHDLIRRTAVDLRAPGAAAPAGATRVDDALRAAGLEYSVANLPFGAQDTLASRLGVGTLDLPDYAVPQSAVDDLTRMMRRFDGPEAATGLLGAYDKLTSLTKAWQTSPFPGFHVRNLVGGAAQNIAQGGLEPGLDPLRALLKPMADAKKLYGGGVLDDLLDLPGLAAPGAGTPTAAEATRALAEEMYAQGIMGSHLAAGREAVGAAGQPIQLAMTLGDILAQTPGVRPQGFAAAAGELGSAAKWSDWLPWNTAGVGANVDLNPVIKAGRAAGDVVEGTNRGALYLALRRQGYLPEAAAQKVIEAHFDYSRGSLSDFENAVMRRVMPFYSWTRFNLPFTARQIAERPGGLAGIQARAAADLRQDAGFLPEYLGQGLAVPVGQEEGGTRRYLTRVDLPAEQAFDFLRGGVNPATSTMMSLLGQLNPIVKAPLELATGKQFFTGRDLEDLYTMTGNTALDQAIMNSPASRTLTTLRTLADERKWANPVALPVNLLTGLKLTDVDMEKQRRIAGREYVQEALRGVPEVGRLQTLYPRAGAIESLSPEELALLRLNRTLELRAIQDARKRKVLVGG